MNLSRIPAKGEKPALFAAISTHATREGVLVDWVLDTKDGSFMELFPDRNWWEVTAEGTKITFEATCWYYMGGFCSITLTDEKPDDMALLVFEAANILAQGQ